MLISEIFTPFVQFFIVLVVILVFVFLMVRKVIEYRIERADQQQSEVQEQKDNKGNKFQNYIDNVPFALQQLQKLYEEQYNALPKEMNDDDKKKTLKPIADRINLLQKVQDYEPLARVGADIADKGVKVINKWMDKLGKV